MALEAVWPPAARLTGGPVPAPPARAFSRTSGTVDVRLDDTSIMRASGLADRRTDGRAGGWTSERADIVARAAGPGPSAAAVGGPTTGPRRTLLMSPRSTTGSARRSPAYFVTGTGVPRRGAAHRSTARMVRHRDAADPRTRPMPVASQGRDPDRFKTASRRQPSPLDDE